MTPSGKRWDSKTIWVLVVAVVVLLWLIAYVSMDAGTRCLFQGFFAVRITSPSMGVGVTL